MPINIDQLFAELSPAEPPQDLLASIMAGIDKKNRLRSIRRHLAIFSVASVISLAFAVPLCFLTWQASAASGFMDFISLLFSDSGFILAYWQSYSSSLLETLPALELALSISMMLIFLEFMKYLARDLSALHKLKLT